MSTSLSAYLRTVIESVGRLGGAVLVFGVPGDADGPDGVLRPGHRARSTSSARIEINPAAAFAMIDRMLGGTGQPVALNRPLTEIEQNVVDAVVKLLLDGLSEAWKPVDDR